MKPASSAAASHRPRISCPTPQRAPVANNIDPVGRGGEAVREIVHDPAYSLDAQGGQPREVRSGDGEVLRDAHTVTHFDRVPFDREREVGCMVQDDASTEVGRPLGIESRCTIVLRDRAGDGIGTRLHLLAAHEVRRYDLGVVSTRGGCVEPGPDSAAQRDHVAPPKHEVGLADQRAAKRCVALPATCKANRHCVSDIGFRANIETVA